MKLIDGKLISEKIYQQITNNLKDSNLKPKLGVILASNDEASKLYVEKMKIKKAESLGIETELKSFNENVTPQEVIEAINQFNNDKNTHGILVQVPFYSHLEKDRYDILNAVDPDKDADGLTALNLGLSSELDKKAIYPATVDAILECIKFVISELKEVSDNQLYSFLQSKKILIINNTILIGKPLALILSSYNATITIANEFTKDLKEMALQSDILISATNKTNIVDSQMVKKNTILIDVTSNKVDGKILGDIILSDKLMDMEGWLTPVPGGVGPLTIACLMRNVVRLSQIQNP